MISQVLTHFSLFSLSKQNWQGKNVMSPLAMEENRVRSAIYLAAIQKNAEEVQAGLRYKSRAADTTTPLSRGL